MTTYLNNADIQESLVTFLKNCVSITKGVPCISSIEIRENQWQGTHFAFPCLRVQLTDLEPDGGCSFSNSRFTLMILTQNESSRDCDILASNVASAFPEMFISVGLRFSVLHVLSIVPAERVDNKTWLSLVKVKSRITKI